MWWYGDWKRAPMGGGLTPLKDQTRRRSQAPRVPTGDEPERESHISDTSWNGLPLGSICSYRLFKEPWVDTFIRLRPDYLREPPSADPHARWCGEGELKSPTYPIRHILMLSNFL